MTKAYVPAAPRMSFPPQAPLTCGACDPCRYRAALDAAVGTGQVEVVANLLEELAARQGLASALGEGLSPGQGIPA